MAVALTLLAEDDTKRKLHLYDTFEGMTPPTGYDLDRAGNSAESLLKSTPSGTGVWSYASLPEVQSNLASTDYPKENIRYIQGPVEKTLPRNLPGPLALLRLDTDWYESTLCELQLLYPLLSRNGVLILDDYGHWQGARKAADDYFASIGCKPLLHRLDYTGRLMIKVEG